MIEKKKNSARDFDQRNWNNRVAACCLMRWAKFMGGAGLGVG